MIKSLVIPTPARQHVSNQISDLVDALAACDE
jgi:hypothetical protein